MQKWKVILIILCCILLIAIAATVLTGCGTESDSKIGYNKQIFDFNQKFTNAYVNIGGVWTDLKIKSWNDYDGEQIQIILEDGTVMLVNSVNCILYNGNLPNKKYYLKGE